MKISAQLFVTPRCLPMVELLTIVVESFEWMKVLALIVDHVHQGVGRFLRKE